MTDFTPTTDEVRDHWVRSQWFEDPLRRESFDRWLAAHDRTVAAKALRDAADAECLRLRWHSGVSIRGLRDRAARIEQNGEGQ